MSNPSGTASVPLAFHTSCQQRAQDQRDAIHTLQTLFATVAANVAGTEGRAQRPVHARGQALPRGTLRVLPALTNLDGAALADDGDAQRKATAAFFSAGNTGSAAGQLRVQRCVDIEAMPVGDASVTWPGELSPYVAVARLCVPHQTTAAGSTSRRPRAGRDPVSGRCQRRLRRRRGGAHVRGCYCARLVEPGPGQASR